MFYDKTILPNGITVITESIDSVRSVALGVWACAGSRDEEPDEAGVSHFLEHMMFKGTPTRSAQDISEGFERLGAEVNAFTSKEYTCYYSRVIDRHVTDAFGILADMVVNSVHDADACKSEREVVLEEISRSEDTPDDKVHDLFAQAMWPDHPIGRPVLGRRETVGAFLPEAVFSYTGRHYRTGDIVVAAAGNCTHDEIVALATDLLAGLPAGPRAERALLTPTADRRIAVVTKDTEQAHICWGTFGLPAGHDDRFALGVLDGVLGGGMASRLFVEIREKRGLAYAVYSYHGQYRDTGCVTVYAGTRPDNTAQVVGLIAQEVEKVLSGGITAEELDRSRESMKGHLVLGLENTSKRMMRLGTSEMGDVAMLSIDELVERIDAVTLEDVDRVAKATLGGPRTLTVVGPHAEADIDALLQ
ncbi:MAG: pitrilysin family protein [Coriobacteriia bacterium]|nr:pitrilysin family protein [Coriobacteriia bacterium]